MTKAANPELLSSRNDARSTCSSSLSCPVAKQIHRHDIADAFEVVHCLDQLDDLAAIFRAVLRFRYLASVLKDRGGQTANFHAVVSQNFKVVRRSLNHGRYPASRQLHNELTETSCFQTGALQCERRRRKRCLLQIAWIAGRPDLAPTPRNDEFGKSGEWPGEPDQHQRADHAEKGMSIGDLAGRLGGEPRCAFEFGAEGDMSLTKSAT